MTTFYITLHQAFPNDDETVTIQQTDMKVEAVSAIDAICEVINNYPHPRETVTYIEVDTESDRW